ncbi:MAG: hypothetical protein WD708_06770 [Kiritimatiellia bacterium]
MNAHTTNWTERLSPKQILLFSVVVVAGVIVFSIITELNRVPPSYLRNREEEAPPPPEEEPRQAVLPLPEDPPGNLFKSPAITSPVDSDPDLDAQPEIDFTEMPFPLPTPTPEPPSSPAPEPQITRLRYSGMITRINGEKRALLSNLETGTDHLLAIGEKWDQWVVKEMTPASLTFETPETVHTLELGQPFESVQP